TDAQPAATTPANGSSPIEPLATLLLSLTLGGKEMRRRPGTGRTAAAPRPTSAPGEGPMDDHAQYFTLDEANRTLPLVERIVKDIVDAYPVFQEQLQTFLAFASTVAGPDLKERLDSLRAEI